MCSIVMNRCQAATPASLRRNTDHQNRMAVSRKLRCCRRCSATLATAASNNSGACQAQIATPWSNVALRPALSHCQQRLRAGRLRKRPDRRSGAAAAAPTASADRSRHHQQRRRNRHDDLVLDHVKGEEMFAEPVQRRDQRARRARASLRNTRALAILEPRGRPPSVATALHAADRVKQRQRQARE